jgi:hypothetical protein
MLLFLDGSVGFRLLGARPRFASLPLSGDAPKQGNIVGRAEFMLGIICDQVLIQASGSACRPMNFFSESRQVFFGRMQRNSFNSLIRYRP